MMWSWQRFVKLSSRLENFGRDKNDSGVARTWFSGGPSAALLDRAGDPHCTFVQAGQRLMGVVNKDDEEEMRKRTGRMEQL